MSEGYFKGEVCNRNGCKGIIDEHEKGGCSCHDNPPCSSCTTAYEYCPVCDWQHQEEIDEEYEKRPKAKVTEWVQPKRRTIADLDNTKVGWIISKTWHSGMELTGVYPEGTSMADVIEKLKEKSVRFDKVCMPKFKYFDQGRFVFSYFTD